MENSDTPSPTPMGPCSTTPTCWSVRGRGWRGRNRPARGELALEQVPQSGQGWRRAAGSASQRVQDRQPHRTGPDPGGRARRADAGLRLHPALRGAATTRPPCTSSWRPPSTRCWTTSPGSRTTPGTRRSPTVSVDLEVARPLWPMIVLRTPKGWTGPKTVDGLPVEGTFRSHQVPLSETRNNADAPAAARAVDAQLPTRRAVRRAPAGCSPGCRPWPPPATAG